MDIKDKLLYKIDKKTMESRISTLKIGVILATIFCIILLIIAGFNSMNNTEGSSSVSTTPITSLSLTNDSANVSSENKSCSITGTTEASTVLIKSESLNISQKVNVTNGSFEFNITEIPEELNTGTVEISAEVQGKEKNTQTFTINVFKIYTSGGYKVGSDIPEGEYKFTQSEGGVGMVERFGDSSKEDLKDVQTIDKVGNSFYITIKNGEYVTISSGELVKA
ncbi:MAG: hypothetical protein LBM96_01165 [Methanobrevibacter sp.]|jgi:hypothetical protein|nr:hypothetical protein [Candidatus Methanoflexus mossambicus]